MGLLQNQRLASFRQAVVGALPTLGTALAGVAAGVVLVISCNMGPPISMAGGSSGGDTSGGSSGGSTGGDTGGATSGTSGGATGGSGGSCSCSLSGPIAIAGPVTISGPVTNIPASEDSAQLASGQLPYTSTAAPGAFDCSAVARNASATYATSGASCIKLADGPFVLTDLITIPSDLAGQTFLFAAPPSATWASDTQVQWFVAQAGGGIQTVVSYTGMHYVVSTGNSLYAISSYASFNPGQTLPTSFSWAGFTPYH